MKSLTWNDLSKLEAAHGDAFFLFDPAAFEANYQEFLQAFRSIYPQTNLAYSYKTNYMPPIVRTVDRLGGYAEVVSGMEYDLACQIGVDPAKIIFNGPYKGPEALEKAFLAGSIVNLDGLHEVDALERVARQHPEQKIVVGLRCNFDLGRGQTSRFGFDVDGADFTTALAHVGALSNVHLAGLHCHFSTGERSVESYVLRAQRMIALTDKYLGDQDVHFINLGGGFFSKMDDSLKAQFNVSIPTYEDYGRAIAPVLADRYPGSTGPELILEPGAAVVASTMWFVARIIEVKRIGSQRLAVTTGSVHNIKPTLNNKNLPLRIVRPAGSPAAGEGPVDLVGYTCMEIDHLYQGHAGPVSAGDYAVFANVGGYTNVMKPPFIKPAPPILSLSGRANEVEVVKRAETTGDIFATYGL